MNRKAYIAIVVIGILLSVIGIYIYGIYQPNDTQTPIKIYRGPTEAEEAVVKEYIKSAIEQQNKKKQQKAAKPQPSSVNYASSQNEEFDDKTKHKPQAPVAMQSENDIPETASPTLQQMLEEIQEHANSLPPDAKSLPPGFEELIKDLESKGIDLGLDEENAKKVITALKAGDKNGSYIITVDGLSDIDMDGNTWIEVEIDDNVDQVILISE